MESFQEGVDQREILEALDIALGDLGLSFGTARLCSIAEIGLGLRFQIGSGSGSLSSSESFESVSVDLWPSFSGHRGITESNWVRPCRGLCQLVIRCARCRESASGIIMLFRSFLRSLRQAPESTIRAEQYCGKGERGQVQFWKIRKV